MVFLIRNSILLLCVWVVIIMIAGCAQHNAPIASGPVRQLNVGHWEPGPNELTTPATSIAKVGS